MRYFTVHLPNLFERRLTQAQLHHIKTQQVLDSSKLVREGFNWEAFFLAISWALRHRLWFAALSLTAIFGILIYAPLIFGLNISSHIILLLGFAFFCGFNANDWHRTGLSKKGWKLVGIVSAKNVEQAYARFERVLMESHDTFVEPGASFRDDLRSIRNLDGSSNNPDPWFFDN